MDNQNDAFPECTKTECLQNQNGSVLHLAVHKLSIPGKKKKKGSWFCDSVRFPKLLGELSSCQVHVCAPSASLFCASLAP